MIYKLHLNHEPWLYAILAEMCFILIFILIDSPQSRQTPPWRCPDLLSVLTFSHDGVLMFWSGGLREGSVWSATVMSHSVFPHLLCPSSAHFSALRWIYCQWQDGLAACWEAKSISNHLLRPTLSPLIAITCLGLVSHEFWGSEVFSANCRPFQTVGCTEFSILAALPSQFIFSRRLLGLYNVTLMRQVSACAPLGAIAFFPPPSV